MSFFGKGYGREVEICDFRDFRICGLENERVNIRTCAISAGVDSVSATTTLSIGSTRWVRPVFEAIISSGEGRPVGGLIWGAAWMAEVRRGRRIRVVSIVIGESC